LGSNGFVLVVHSLGLVYYGLHVGPLLMKQWIVIFLFDAFVAIFVVEKLVRRPGDDDPQL